MASINQYVCDGKEFKSAPLIAYNKGSVAEIEQTQFPIENSDNAAATDTAIYIEGLFSNTKSYFMNTKIKIIEGEKAEPFSKVELFNFDIYLCRIDNKKLDTSVPKQFIKSIEIKNGEYDDNNGINEIWNSVSFSFCPYDAIFNGILFQMTSRSKGGLDYFIKDKAPKAVIVAEELSTVQNLLDGTDIIKIGIISSPGALFSINNEDIQIGRSGIYEFKNNAITINSFSVIAPQEDGEYSSETTSSTCIFDENRTRKSSPFIVDYITR